MEDEVIVKDTDPRPEDYRLRTRLIHGKYNTERWDYSHHVVPPISSSATFRLSSSQRGAQGFFEFACDKVNATRDVPIYIYDRLDEPGRGMLEDALAVAEQAEMSVTFATGMAAITAAINSIVRVGDDVLSHDLVYGCTYSFMLNWLPRQGVTARFIDMKDLAAVERAIKPNTRVLYFESPVNPNLELIDIRGLRAVADRVNQNRSPEEHVKVVIDNTFATPYCQRPLALGCDLVVHSLTKGIGGFGTDMGGVVVGPKNMQSVLMFYRKDYGGVLSPKAAWNMLVYGLPSLATRMLNMQRTAKKVAEFLEQHPKVERVIYPGLASYPQRELAEAQMIDYRGKFAPGSIIYFTLKDPGGKNERAERFINHVADKAYCITLAVSLGQVKTLIENPYSMTHSSYMQKPGEECMAGGQSRGVEPGGIRLSVGLEDWHDIIADLDTSLQQA